MVDVESAMIFDPEEFEMVLNGVPFIDLADWREQTVFKGVYTSSHKVVGWFWEILGGFSQEQLAKLLRFATGSSRTPVEGFRSLESNRGELSPFCLNSVAFDEKKPHIIAHTCFNRLDLPIYPSLEKMKESLELITKMDFEGFFGIKE